MNEKDDVLLEYLADVGSAEPPKVIHWNISEDRKTGQFSIDTARRRLERLSNLGLVTLARESGAYFKITDYGRAYLAGDLDASELED